ncbi:MAG TPA: hypothetical protein VGX48_03105 [Pyrinomonadaceae bacterium]|jgi:hypothetical protein|nr:hypothetical protein [Pyrinomonadaceae bacterium]
MKRKTTALAPLLFACALLLLCPAAAEACSCTGYPTVCQAYAGADAVFVGTVQSVESVNVKKGEDGREYYESQLARVSVERVFKNMKQTEVVFRAGNSSCDTVYEEGQRRLFYAYYDAEDKTWAVRPCDRSSDIESAADDLAYLQGLPASAERTRLAGTLIHYEDEPGEGFNNVGSLNGVRVRAVGAQKTYETHTSADGLFEFNGLPPGSYSVVPDVPRGLKMRFPMFYGEVERSADGGVRVVLKEKSCAGVNFVYSADTNIAGRVFGADGRPLKDVCLCLMPEDRKVAANWNFDCTDEQGRYQLNDIPPGRYRIVLNDDGKISSDEPFPTAYHPGVFERERATVIVVTEGTNLKDFDIHIPRQEATRVIQGVLLFEDGRPAADEFVEFHPDAPAAGYDSEAARAKTDDRGRFSLTVLEGFKGRLLGAMITYSGEYLNCPKLERILKRMGDSVHEVETPSVKMEVTSDVQGVRLVFPFPSCAKAKKE